VGAPGQGPQSAKKAEAEKVSPVKKSAPAASPAESSPNAASLVFSLPHDLAQDRLLARLAKSVATWHREKVDPADVALERPKGHGTHVRFFCFSLNPKD